MRRRRIDLNLAAIVALFFFSCGSGKSGQATAASKDSTVAPVTHAFDQSLTTGKLIDSVICKNQSSHSYALYLPSYYSSSKPFPCVYFFDAHGRGSMPVSAYKSLAEKYGLVMIGSNVSRNGNPRQAITDLVKILRDDTRTRINIDPKRTYTCGFSGGSRVASSVAIFDGDIAGVIGCSAGFPGADNTFQTKFDYFGMAGEYDFNMIEMEQLDLDLQRNGFTHQLLTFAGKHEWAPAADMETGVLWLLVNGMKENRQPKNDTLIHALKDDYAKRINASSGDLIKKYQLLDGMVRVLDGVTDISTYKAQLAALDVSQELKDASAMRGKLLEQELDQQRDLAKAFPEHDEKWWGQKIAEINHNIRGAKTAYESQMNKRELSYLGFVGYMSSNHALNTGDLAHAEQYIKVFKMADPQNPDCSYLHATLYMKQGNTQKAISALNEAAKAGYNDVSQLMTDRVFGTLHEDAGFKDVVSKVGGNSKGKP